MNVLWLTVMAKVTQEPCRYFKQALWSPTIVATCQAFIVCNGEWLVFKEGEEYMDDIDDEEKKVIESNGKWIFNNGYQYLMLDKNYLVDKEGSDVNRARLETVTDHIIPYGI